MNKSLFKGFAVVAFASLKLDPKGQCCIENHPKGTKRGHDVLVIAVPYPTLLSFLASLAE